MKTVNNYLYKHYYFNNDGTSDEIADSLGDCIIQCAYVILKNKYCLKEDFYKSFLNETTIKLGVSDNNKIETFDTIENIFDKKIFSLYGFEKINEKALDKISEILKSGDIPAIATVVENLRFSVFYDNNYKQNCIRTRHVFIIVGEDAENIYYIDNPGVISYKNYVGLSDNKEIGVISKKDFNDAVKCCCDVFTFKFDLEKINYFINNPLDALNDSYENYHCQHKVRDGVKYYFGRQALLKLIDLFELGNILLDEIAPSKDRDMITYLNWKIWNIKGRRKLLKKFLNDSDNSEYREMLIHSVNDAILNWDLLDKALYRDFLKGNRIAGSQYVFLIREIINCEDKINLFLNKYLHDIEHNI